MICGLLSNKNKYWFYVITIICFLSEFLYRYYIDINLIWNIDLSILAVVFMILGYMWKNWINKQGIKSLSKLIITVPIFIIANYINYVLYGKIDWWGNQFGNPILFIFIGMTGVVSVCILSNFISFKMLEELGKKSLIFYGFHRIVIDASFILFNKLGVNIIKGHWSSVLWAFVSVGIVFIIIWPVSYVIENYFPWIIGKRK